MSPDEQHTDEQVSQEEAPERQWPEPAPTDFRRNIWLLALIVGVVVLAWLLSLLSRWVAAA